MDSCDVAVHGGGIVGRTLALELASHGLEVALLAPPPRAGTDLRAYALNAGSVNLLRALKVWDALPAQAATPVYDMHVSGDAPEGAQAGSIEFSAWQQRVGELAWIVDAAVLERELAAAVRFAPHVQVIPPDDTSTRGTLTALCEGKASATREALGVAFERHDYGHSAIAARLTASAPHCGIARQWFRSPDVLALLPFDTPAAGQPVAAGARDVRLEGQVVTEAVAAERTRLRRHVGGFELSEAAEARGDIAERHPVLLPLLPHGHAAIEPRGGGGSRGLCESRERHGGERRSSEQDGERAGGGHRTRRTRAG